MVDELGNWKWPLLQHLLTLPILLRIMAIKVPSPLFPDDEDWRSIIDRSRLLADSTKNAFAGRHSLSQQGPSASLLASPWFTPQ
ncbi:hypothetical protein V6N12_009590 [Hibiscus sabdariffa]|uniref:Uncharacterized protein n=1 Tax=Hibiscus sabdariffa TaxID=183260 RepID=A0ABR2B2E8_9ROSI